MISYYMIGDLMKLEEVSKDYYKIFINNYYTDRIDFNSKSELEIFLKKILVNLNIRYEIELSGFYEAAIYNNQNVGTYIYIKKINNYPLYNKSIDLKIVLYLNYEFYYKTEFFELISKYDDIYYSDNFYYLNINNICDDIINIVEFGTLINKIEFLKNKNEMLKI